VEAKIFEFIGLRKLNIIDFNWWAGRTPCSEGDGKAELFPLGENVSMPG
jgi:hypothetical protein